MVVIFRGTGVTGQVGATTRNTFLTDMIVLPVKLNSLSAKARSELPATQQKARVLDGFQRAYSHLRPRVMQALNSDAARGKPVFVIGHSLGGAMASLLAMDVALNMKPNFASLDVYTSGSPRVGNADFVRLYDRFVPNSIHIAIDGDPVPLIPRMNDVHHGKLLILAKDGQVVHPHTLSTNVELLNFGSHHKQPNYVRAVRDFVNGHIDHHWLKDRVDGWVTDSRRVERDRTEQDL